MTGPLGVNKRPDAWLRILAMTDCWAGCLGGCVGSLSSEHVISAGLWESTMVEVSGLPWCSDTPKLIGVASLTANILCERHNNALSPVDMAGIGAFRALREAYSLAAGREGRRLRKWKVQRFIVDGPGFERWLLKTTLNLCASRQLHSATWQLTGQPVTSSPDQLVRAAFGHEELSRPLGLYGLGSVGETVSSGEHVEFATILGAGALVGTAFRFRGHRCLLWLSNAPVPKVLTLDSQHGTEWATGDLLYHLALIRWKIGKKLSHVCQFTWPGRSVSPLLVA